MHFCIPSWQDSCKLADMVGMRGNQQPAILENPMILCTYSQTWSKIMSIEITHQCDHDLSRRRIHINQQLWDYRTGQSMQFSIQQMKSDFLLNHHPVYRRTLGHQNPSFGDPANPHDDGHGRDQQNELLTFHSNLKHLVGK